MKHKTQKKHPNVAIERKSVKKNHQDIFLDVVVDIESKRRYSIRPNAKNRHILISEKR